MADCEEEKCGHAHERCPIRDILGREVKRLEERMDLRFESFRIASDKAAGQMDERLARMNEFREALKDQSGTFITRSEVALMLEPLQKDVQIARDFISRHEGKASIWAVVGVGVLALLSLVVSLFEMFTNR